MELLSRTHKFNRRKNNEKDFINDDGPRADDRSPAQKETIDTAQFVAVYDYECRTLDAEGQGVTDRMQVVVQVGRTVTKSMPRSVYRLRDESEEADVLADYQEAYLHMPTVWTGYPEGQTTVREFIFPHEYEGYEETPDIAWTLTDDTLTVSGYLCQQATATFRGVEWRVWYTEEIPSSAGPWRLRGLPGLIVKAESEAHTFCLAKLQEERGGHHRPGTAPRCAADEIRQAAETQERDLWQPSVCQESCLLCARPPR